LREHHITYHEITLKANHILIAHGGCAHFGFTTEPGETISFAINYAPVRWMDQDVVEFILDYFRWIDKLQKQYPTKDAMMKTLTEAGCSEQEFVDALNICPHNYTCSFLSGLKHDLTKSTKGSGAKHQYPTLSLDAKQRILDTVESILSLVRDKELRAWYGKWRKDQACICNHCMPMGNISVGPSDAGANANIDAMITRTCHPPS